MLPYDGSIEQKMSMNAIDVSDEAAGLFLVMAIANHDCIGNADHMYLEDYGVRILVASRKIRKGEEIRHYYTDPLTPRKQRRSKLRRLYGINCNCMLCSSPELEEMVCEVHDVNVTMELCNEIGDSASAMQKGEELLRIYNEMGVVSTKIEMWVYFELFRSAIVRKETVEQGVAYLRQAHRCFVQYTGDSRCSEVKRIEELIDSPQKHKDYMKLDRKR